MLFLRRATPVTSIRCRVAVVMDIRRHVSPTTDHDFASLCGKGTAAKKRAEASGRRYVLLGVFRHLYSTKPDNRPDSHLNRVLIVQ